MLTMSTPCLHDKHILVAALPILLLAHALTFVQVKRMSISWLLLFQYKYSHTRSLLSR